jgi:hypothetical protein
MIMANPIDRQADLLDKLIIQTERSLTYAKVLRKHYFNLQEDLHHTASQALKNGKTYVSTSAITALLEKNLKDFNDEVSLL